MLSNSNEWFLFTVKSLNNGHLGTAEFISHSKVEHTNNTRVTGWKSVFRECHYEGFTTLGWETQAKRHLK